MWHHEAGAMKSGLMTESLVALVTDVEAIRLESSLIREVWSYVGLFSSLSVFPLPAWCVYALCLPAEREISSVYLLVLVLVLSVILHLYAAGCPAYCSVLYLSCSLLTFSWLDASCVQLYVYLFPLLVFTLLRHMRKVLMRCVWLCYDNGTKYLHAVIGYTF